MTVPSPLSPFGRRSFHAPLVAFRRASLSHASDRAPVLSDVSFAIPDGGLTAIVGAGAAGKTALFALLQRRCAPTGGAILLDGHDLAAVPRHVLRRAIGRVDRDPPVLAGTLRDNLRGTAPEVSGGELVAVVAEARLDDLVARLPDGLDSELADPATRLRDGERQRIAIARALLRRPRLLLLDEAGAQLDAREEHALGATVARAAVRCTVLVIARRRATVLGADQVVVIDEGRVHANGTHADLIASDARYRELIATQLTAASAA